MEQNGKTESIFRKKSVDRINSPEALDDYLRIANPGVWIVLVTIALFLVGIFVWSIYGHLDTTISCPLVVTDGTAIIFIPDDDMDSIQEGMTVFINDTSGKIGKISRVPILAESMFNAYRMHKLKLWEGLYLFTAPVPDFHLKDGYYMADVLIESSSPFKMIFQ